MGCVIAMLGQVCVKALLATARLGLVGGRPAVQLSAMPLWSEFASNRTTKTVKPLENISVHRNPSILVSQLCSVLCTANFLCKY
jgi:hypothetical protein